MLKFFLKICIVFFAICIAIECVIFVIGISYNIMNPWTKGVSFTDFKHWLIITLPTVVLLLVVILLRKYIREPFPY
jgi:H+/Cl- antiporter ClcA